MSLKRVATLIGCLVGVATLLLQFWLTYGLRLGSGDNPLGAVIYYFTFFTILTNLMLVLIYLSDLNGAKWLGWWRSPVTRGMMAGAMTLVTIFYHFFLASIWDPQGWFKVADVTLHYILPIYYLLWWLIFAAHGTLSYRNIPAMLLPPTLYLAWAMLRGAVVNEYPYPLLEADTLGYPQVVINVLLVLVGLIALYAAAIAVDRAIGKRATTAA